MQSYQFEQISADPDKPLADGIRPLDTADMERYVLIRSRLKERPSFVPLFIYPHQCFSVPLNHILSFLYRLKDVQTLEELGDVYNHFLLYYGRDIPKMQNAAKANKKRLKKIKEVSEDGKMSVLAISLDDGRILQNCSVLIVQLVEKRFALF